MTAASRLVVGALVAFAGMEHAVLAGDDAGRFGLVNEYLSHLADRNYSPCTLRAYGFDLLAFCRWLAAEEI